MSRAPQSEDEPLYNIRAEGFSDIDMLLQELGEDSGQAFKEAELSLSILRETNKNQRIDYRKFLNLLNGCAERTGRKDFGNLLSGYQDMTVIGVPGQAMYEAKDFRTALRDLIDFFHLHMNGMRVEFVEQERSSLVSLQVVMPFPPDYRQQVELSLGIGLRFVRRLLGYSWSPDELFFEHREDSGSRSTQALFRCPVTYETEFNGFTFASSALDIEKENFNSQAHQILYDYLCLQTRSVRPDFLIRVREQLVASLRSGDCGIDGVSERLGLSRRTLQRKLKGKGCDFSDLLENTRMDLAQRYLSGSQLPITQISDILRYAEPSSFSRSFRRYTGLSPRAWRRQKFSDG